MLHNAEFTNQTNRDTVDIFKNKLSSFHCDGEIRYKNPHRNGGFKALHSGISIDCALYLSSLVLFRFQQSYKIQCISIEFGARERFQNGFLNGTYESQVWLMFAMLFETHSVLFFEKEKTQFTYTHRINETEIWIHVNCKWMISEYQSYIRFQNNAIEDSSDRAKKKMLKNVQNERKNMTKGVQNIRRRIRSGPFVFFNSMSIPFICSFQLANWNPFSRCAQCNRSDPSMSFVTHFACLWAGKMCSWQKLCLLSCRQISKIMKLP